MNYPKIKFQLLIIVLLSFLQGCQITSNNESKSESLATESNSLVTIATMSVEDNIYYTDEDSKIYTYEDTDLLDEKIFEFLKETYNEINFFGTFQKGTIEEYNFYKSKYQKMLNNERFFTEVGEDKEFYIKDYDTEKIDSDTQIYDANGYTYYFFDMDEDKVPELCMTDNTRFIYIFKYIKDTDKFILWKSIPASYFILGSRKLGHSGSGIGVTNSYFELNQNGEENLSLHFYSEEHLNPKNNTAEIAYMIGIPEYSSKNETIELKDEWKKKRCFSERYGRYFFKLTESQFNEITKDFFDSEKLAKENIKEVTFTYNQLFDGIYYK